MGYIELIIKIDEQTYNNFVRNEYYRADVIAMHAALTNGVVLQKKDKVKVLDKMRDEFISLYPKDYAGEPELGGVSCLFSLNKVLSIIDKYKAESEE